MIRVVAQRALEQVTIDTPVVARTMRSLAGRSARLDVLASFDAELDSFDAGSLTTIADALNRLGTEQDIVYVVPGCGVPGDVTVDLIENHLLGEIAAGAPDRNRFGSGGCLVIDALELAQARLEAPFHRGLATMDPAVPLVVTNWYGDTVVPLAVSLLEDVYGETELPEPTGDFELHIPAVERITSTASMASLEHVVARLRRPDGCPWDRDQTRASLFPQFVSELEELGEAIANNDIDNQREELGDVLFHIVAQCQLAAEAGEFTLDDVLRGVTGKLVRRHPHVFGDDVAETYEDVLRTWQRVKAEEKSAVRADQ